MTRFILIFIVILMITNLPFSSSANEKVMLIGDSLSAGYGLNQEQAWVHLLQNKYTDEKKAITLINTAISGQTTDNALLNIDAWLETHNPTHVLIELGGNDGIRGFPVTLLQKHLTQLITKSQLHGADVALMTIDIPPNLGKRYRELFTNSYNKVANDTGAYLMPFFMTNIAIVPELIMDDNLHPNAKAQPIIRDFMAIEINKWLESAKRK